MKINLPGFKPLRYGGCALLQHHLASPCWVSLSYITIPMMHLCTQRLKRVNNAAYQNTTSLNIPNSMSHQHSFFLLAYIRGGGCGSLQRMSILIASHSWNYSAGKCLMEILSSLFVRNIMN